MSKQGQHNFKGINSQAWAAMSLFLQFVSKSDFSHIIFEGNKLEDFCLVFNDGKKIVCESKDHTSGVGYSKLKDIIGKVVKHGQINSNDEILIVCPSVDQNVLSDIEHVKYLKEYTQDKLIKNHRFTKDEVALLPQVRFWQINQVISQNSVEALIAYLLGIWVPRHVLSEIVCNIMVVEVYFGSQKGQTLTKKDFLEKLEERKKQAVTDSTYEEDRGAFDKRLEKFTKLVKNPPANNALTNNQITNLSSRPNEYSFLIDRLKGKGLKINLKTWNSFWESVAQGIHSFNVFDIFENNLDAKENISYAVDFCLEFLGQNFNLIRDEFINTDIAKLCGKILDLTSEYNAKILEVIQKLLKPKLKEYFYEFNSRDRQWETGETTGVLEKLYAKSDEDLKQKIVEYILDFFNLSEDEGSLWDNASPGMFRIVKSYYEQDPEKGIKELTKIISDQYAQNYSKFGKKMDFKGWEHFGISISNFGGSYTVGDRHFVHQLLQPILSDYYHNQPEKAWGFIKIFCISRKISEVTAERPDFLNRSVINILLEEYGKGKHKEEAFKILCDFIAMRRGIPWKNDLIFQGISNNKQISDEDKWTLVNFSFKKFDELPVNVFVEQIVSTLAENGHQEALETIVQWSSNPEYLKRQARVSFSIENNISKLLSKNENYSKGVEVLLNYIRQADFSKVDNFDVYGLGKLLTKIIEDNTDKGLSILQELYDKDDLSSNDQTLIASSIEKIAEDKKEVILKIYNQFIKPNFEKLGGQGIEIKFTVRHIREQFIHYVEKLAKIGEFEKAMWLLKKFVNDSDPPKDGSDYLDDKDGTFNYHKKLEEGNDELVITTVRGWCGQSLANLAVAGNQSGMHEVIKIAKILSQDPNNYVRYETCISLLHIATNRRTYMPGKEKIPFLTIKDAQEVEKIVFDMLHDKRNHKIRAIMKRLVDVFGGMRGISEDEALDFLKTVLNTKNDEVIDEAIPLFVYFAEFREKDYQSKVIENVYVDKWQSIKSFKNTKFKILLDDLIKGGSRQIRARIAWQFWRLPTEQKENVSFIKLSLGYFDKIIKSGYDHDTFERVYHFFEEWLDKYPKECLGLWKKCLSKEAPAIQEMSKNKADFDRYYWFPFHYNGKILVKLAEVEGDKEFLKYFEFLLDYPKETSIPMDVNLAVDHLVGIKTDQKIVERIFNKLMERNPNFYESKKKWLIDVKRNKQTADQGIT